ncbi:hypothetical protein [Solidesulfovibrio aerotolerans]|uniref:hypothetical protein n=1 Tax=Solidesulfovibrio aerotolerans TaxID=295255 RepID=UPI00147979DA|nr:hypothetical protein [Solidesulfovibrio aerotolerans]
MLSHTSISSKSRTTGWAKSFLGASRREPAAGTRRESVTNADAGASAPADNARIK